jgi:hypothetical protein
MSCEGVSLRDSVSYCEVKARENIKPLIFCILIILAAGLLMGKLPMTNAIRGVVGGVAALIVVITIACSRKKSEPIEMRAREEAQASIPRPNDSSIYTRRKWLDENGYRLRGEWFEKQLPITAGIDAYQRGMPSGFALSMSSSGRHYVVMCRPEIGVNLDDPILKPSPLPPPPPRQKIGEWLKENGFTLAENGYYEKTFPESMSGPRAAPFGLQQMGQVSDRNTGQCRLSYRIRPGFALDSEIYDS